VTDRGSLAGFGCSVVCARLVAGACGVAAGVVLCGCASEPPLPLDFGSERAFEAPRAYDHGARPVTELVRSRPGGAEAGARARRVGEVMLRASGGGGDVGGGGVGVGGVGTGELMGVRLAFSGAPGSVVARTLLDRYMGVDYLVDDDLPGVVTLEVDEEMSVGDVSRLLHSLALVYGWTVERVDGVVAVRSQSEESVRSVNGAVLRSRAAFGDATPALRVRRMRYVDPEQIAGGSGRNALLSSVLSDGALVATSGPLIVMGDTTARLNRASELLSVLDAPAFDGVRLVTFRLAHKDPEEAAQLLSSLAEGTRLSGAEGGRSLVEFVPVPGGDRLLVIAREASALDQAALLVDQVDRPDTEGRRYRFVYRVQHADTTRLRALIERSFASRIEEDAGVEDTDKMQLTWENQDGLLLVHGSYADYVDLVEMLRVLDGPPQQVLLQVVIAEVTLTDDLEFGVEYFLDALNEDGLGTLELAGTPGGVADPSGSAFFVGGSGLALIQALDAESSANVLSQPRLTVTDGSTSRFQVGGEVPVVARSQNSDTQVGGDTTLIQDIERVETGVIVEFQPRINESGHVRLETLLEVRSVGVDTPLGPTFDERILNTDVVVPHGRTLVLAGFIDDQRDESSTRVPVLGSIPGVGLPFTTVDDSTLRRELLLTITPTVINDPDESAVLFDEFLESTRRVRAVLTREPNDLPRGYLREQSIDGGGPAVRLILPADPGGDGGIGGVGAGDGVGASGGAASGPGAVGPATGAGSGGGEGGEEPEMPGWMRELLENAEPSGGGGGGGGGEGGGGVGWRWSASREGLASSGSADFDGVLGGSVAAVGGPVWLGRGDALSGVLTAADPFVLRGPVSSLGVVSVGVVSVAGGGDDGAGVAVAGLSEGWRWSAGAGRAWGPGW